MRDIHHAPRYGYKLAIAALQALRSGPVSCLPHLEEEAGGEIIEWLETTPEGWRACQLLDARQISQKVLSRELREWAGCQTARLFPGQVPHYSPRFEAGLLPPHQDDRGEEAVLSRAILHRRL